MPETYELCPSLPYDGELDAPLARFRGHPVRLLARSGGAAAAANRAAFGADPKAQAVSEDAMRDGRLVETIDKTFLTLTTFSPVP